MKINLGSGTKRYPGYINIDLNSSSNPDFVIDIEFEKLPFENNSVDGVIAHHVLEHLGEGFFHCIRELYRVCKHNTIIDVKVPHPRHDIFLIDPTHQRPIFPHTLDMFSKDRNKKDLESGGCETPIGFINDVNLYVSNYVPVLDEYWHNKFQNMTEEECEHAARSFNNVVTEYHIQWVVDKESKYE